MTPNPDRPFAIPQASVEHLEKHYADLKEKPFFPGLVKYMAAGPVVAMVWEGNALQHLKKYVAALTSFSALLHRQGRR